MSEVDFIQLAPGVGKHFLGEPSKVYSNEWRWGTNGSWCLTLDTGLFYSFELDDGGGVLWLIDHFNGDRSLVLNQLPNTKPMAKAKTFTSAQMKKLAIESIVLLRYTDRFVVMRFSEGHYIKQKYAPFTKINDEWHLKRPEGQMPIYYKDGDGPVVINEGEKATIGCKQLYDGPVATWHGGVNSWKKCDWSQVFNKEVLIWPDNDEAGTKCANELSSYLKENGCKVAIAKIPEGFNDKDDLYDAYANKYFNKETFADYIESIKFKAPKPSLVLKKVSELITSIPEPEWIIDNVMEKDSVMEIYGAPKSGKSFIAIDMALCASLGIDWHGHKTVKTPTVYLAGEGQRGIARRVKAWEQYNNIYLDEAELFISDRGIRFLDEKDHQNLIDHIYHIVDLYGDIGCIYVDTLARNFGAGNENSTEDMNLFIERVDMLKNEFNACISLIHHTGHNASGRARGSSVLPAAVDAEFAVKRQKDVSDEMKVEFAQTLIKDGKPMGNKFFQFKEVDLIGFDQVTSGVLIPIEASDYFNQDESKIDETALLIGEIQQAKAKAENTDPINIWVKQIEVINKSEISESAVKQRLKRLRESDKVYYEERKGYQSKMFDEIK